MSSGSGESQLATHCRSYSELISLRIAPNLLQPAKIYLEFGQQGVAHAREEHHGHQKRYHPSLGHECGFLRKGKCEASLAHVAISKPHKHAPCPIIMSQAAPHPRSDVNRGQMRHLTHHARSGGGRRDYGGREILRLLHGNRTTCD